MIKIKLLKEKEKLVGGAGDNVPDSDFDPKQLAIGLKDETGEHTPDLTIGKEIAKDHLSNDPDYYKKLKAAGIDEKKNNKLSSYWKKRAKRRAIKAKRTWPNGKDRKWALEEQEKSKQQIEKTKQLQEITKIEVERTKQMEILKIEVLYCIVDE
jgi:hypothetical protein